MRNIYLLSEDDTDEGTKISDTRKRNSSIDKNN